MEHAAYQVVSYVNTILKQLFYSKIVLLHQESHDKQKNH